ncbi:MAG: ankyrin repeat domain-containing protein [Candidatus Sifarchaeia archaeon]
MRAKNENLIAAAETGNLDAVKEALESGADIDAQNEYMKDSALHLAASRGHLKIVQYLLEKEANLLLTNATDMTPLHIAARDGQTQVVQFLLEKAGKIPERVLNDIIHVASMSVYGRPEIVQMLEDFRVEQAKPSTSSAEKEDSILLEAAEVGNLEDAQKALEKGANVNVIDDRGMMPIHWAALRGHFQIVHTLLDGNANVNSTNSAEWTPIMHASFEGHSKIVKILIERGAEVNARTYVSGTALMFAAGKGHLEVVRILLDAGADPTIQIVGTESEDGMTSLTYALREGHDEIVEVLRKALNYSE